MGTAKHLICILGPTASGKTAVAVELARKLNCEVLSCDSRQFYSEMQIGTARPVEEELQGVPHHFLGNLSVDDDYTVADYEKDALHLLDNLFQSNDFAILCGGSGLFADAVCYGMDDMPEADENLRTELKEIFATQGIAALQEMLKSLDPEYYEQIDLNNHVRLMRAIEVCKVSGKKYSDLRTGRKAQRPFEIHRYAIQWDREDLNDRINSRVDIMMQHGLLQEATSLLSKRNTNALQSVGYREIFDHLDGQVSLEEAIDKIKVNTRRFAKRQMTWLQKDESIQWMRMTNPELLATEIENTLHAQS